MRKVLTVKEYDGLTDAEAEQYHRDLNRQSVEYENALANIDLVHKLLIDLVSAIDERWNGTTQPKRKNGIIAEEALAAAKQYLEWEE
jgi:hypothetical protein